MSPELLEMVADRFKVLADPARLRILGSLRSGERTVSDIVQETGLSQANTSKHLSLLHALGFVTRRKEGLYTWYALGDKDIFKLCDLMCGRIEAELSVRARAVGRR